MSTLSTVIFSLKEVLECILSHSSRQDLKRFILVNKTFEEIVASVLINRYSLQKFKLTRSQLFATIDIVEWLADTLTIVERKGFGIRRLILASARGPSLLLVGDVKKYITEAKKCDIPKGDIVDLSKTTTKDILNIENMNKIFLLDSSKDKPFSGNKIQTLLGKSFKWTLFVRDHTLPEVLPYNITKTVSFKYETPMHRNVKIISKSACLQLNPKVNWRLGTPQELFENDNWKACIINITSKLPKGSKVVIVSSFKNIDTWFPKDVVSSSYEKFEKRYSRKRNILTIKTYGVNACDADLVIALIDRSWEMEEITNLEYIVMPNRLSYDLYLLAEDDLKDFITVAHARAHRGCRSIPANCYRSLDPETAKDVVGTNTDLISIAIMSCTKAMSRQYHVKYSKDGVEISKQIFSVS